MKVPKLLLLSWSQLLLISWIALFCLLFYSLQAAADVRGRSPVANTICRDILADDADKLDVDLRRYRRGSVFLSRYYRSNSPELHHDFSCNNMRLLEFAEHIGASEVASNLWNKEDSRYKVWLEEVSQPQQF